MSGKGDCSGTTAVSVLFPHRAVSVFIALLFDKLAHYQRVVDSATTLHEFDIFNTLSGAIRIYSIYFK